MKQIHFEVTRISFFGDTSMDTTKYFLTINNLLPMVKQHRVRLGQKLVEATLKRTSP